MDISSKYKMNINKIAEVCNGIIIQGNLDIEIEDYSIDTRNIKNGEMYFAIKGENIDGNDFIEEAFGKGAIGCITNIELDKSILEKYSNKAIIKVKDTIKAIQQLAKYKREQYNIPVVAVTGSVGKTSTKDIIANVLSKKFNVLKTEGNFNNHIGLPLTLLKLKEHTAVVVEMGMNHFGEISILTNIAKPTICVITNIGTSHIGNLGSRRNILKAKLEILEGLKKEGKVLVNNDNDLLEEWVETNKEYNVYTYGINNESNYIAKNILFYENNSEFKIKDIKIGVPVAGEHFIYNAICAFAVGDLLKINKNKIAEGISEFELSKKRMEIKVIKNNIRVINDSYNASFDSMKAVLEVLNSIKAKRKIAVLGNMLELGKFTEELHRKVGIEVVKNNIDILITVGEYAEQIANQAHKLKMQNIYICKNIESAANILNEKLEENDLVLLKASNSMKFSKILDLIK